MFNAIHEPGKRPYLYNDIPEQPPAINQAIINDVNVSGVLPLGMVGDRQSGVVQPNNLPYDLHDRRGTKIVPTNYDAWIVDGEYYYNRTQSLPTGSDTTIFNTVKQEQFATEHNRLPMIVKNKERPKEMTTSIINNTNDRADSVNTVDRVINITQLQPFRQKRQRFTDIDYDYENNLPVYMRSTNLNYMNLGKQSVVDKHTNKLIDNSRNKLLFDKDVDPLDDNTRWNKTDKPEELTTSHNPQSDKQHDNNTFNDGINETFTLLTEPVKQYSMNQRREYFNEKIRANAGRYMGDLITTLSDPDQFPKEEDADDFITDFTIPTRADLTSLHTSDDNFMVNDCEYIYSEPKEHFTRVISSTKEPFDTIERFGNNHTTGVMLYKHVLQSYAVMLTNYLSSFQDFKPWQQYWSYLQKNLNKCDCDFEILKPNDNDVAYVQNKGDIMRFRVEDTQRFVPISIYTYVLCHELAHLANGKDYGHDKNFPHLMHLIELAAYELGILKPDKYPERNYMSNGVVILSKDSIKQELQEGIALMISNGGNKRFYNDLLTKINLL